MRCIVTAGMCIGTVLGAVPPQATPLRLADAGATDRDMTTFDGAPYVILQRGVDRTTHATTFDNLLRPDDKGVEIDLGFQIVLAGDQRVRQSSADNFTARMRSDLACCPALAGRVIDAISAESRYAPAATDPTILALLGSGLVGLGIFGRRKSKGRRASSPDLPVRK